MCRLLLLLGGSGELSISEVVSCICCHLLVHVFWSGHFNGLHLVGNSVANPDGSWCHHHDHFQVLHVVSCHVPMKLRVLCRPRRTLSLLHLHGNPVDGWDGFYGEHQVCHEPLPEALTGQEGHVASFCAVALQFYRRVLKQLITITKLQLQN